jgi:hypothetical protein
MGMTTGVKAATATLVSGRGRNVDSRRNADDAAGDIALIPPARCRRLTEPEHYERADPGRQQSNAHY